MEIKQKKFFFEKKNLKCPLHQSILLTQGPIHEIFTKIFENWRFFKSAILDFFFQKKKKKKRFA